MSRARFVGERYARLTPKRALALLRVVERVLRPGGGLSGGGASRGPDDVLDAEAAPVACRPGPRRAAGTRGTSYGGRS